MSICLIPARGGSKRVPRKNIREFHGKPMIAWSIEAARKAGCFDRVIVSTDDDEIAAVATSFGAEVPFQRPAKLSDDHATTVEVIRHTLQFLNDAGDMPARLCCLYATAPFVQVKDLLTGYALLDDKPFAIPVTRFDYPIQRAVRIREGGLEMFDPDQYKTRSQDLEAAYHDVGQFYWGRTEAWLSDTLTFGPQTAPIILPGWRVQDIDTEEDWRHAEALFSLLSG